MKPNSWCDRLYCVLALMLLAGGAGGACSGDCFDPPPSSSAMEVGESVRVQIEVIDGGYATPDIAGAYWANYDPLPEGMPSDGLVSGTATLVDATFGESGLLLAGDVVVDFDDFGPVRFGGPLSCE